MDRVLTFVMAGGQGERLQPLTLHRAKPSVPFGGIYRIIDFTLSNCLHSGLRQIFVLTQYKSLSLERHIDFGWKLLSPTLGEFIVTVPPQQRVGDEWYLGTADAIYQNWYSVERYSVLYHKPEAIVILAGDHIYKMDYGKMLTFHRARSAELTIGAIRTPVEEARHRLGVLSVDEQSKVIDFDEKPADPSPSSDEPNSCMASMGIYIFDTDMLYEQLNQDAARPDSDHDFGKNIIPAMIGRDRVFAFDFELGNPNETAYWRDVGTLDAYWEANMDLVQLKPEFNLYDQDWPIHTFHRPRPPAKSVREEEGRIGQAVNSLLSPGSVVSGSMVLKSVLSPAVKINSFCSIQDSILFEGVEVGRGAKVHRAILDKGVRIDPGAEIGCDLERDAQRFTVTESGVVVVPKEAVVD